MDNILVSATTTFDSARRAFVEPLVRKIASYRDLASPLVRLAGDVRRAWLWLCGRVDMVAERLPDALASPLVPVVIRDAFRKRVAIQSDPEVRSAPLIEAVRLGEETIWSIAADTVQSGLESAERIDNLQNTAATNIDAASYAFDRLIADLALHMDLKSRGRGEVLPLVVDTKPKQAKAVPAFGRVSRAA